MIGGHRAVKIVQRDMFDDERPFAREFEGMKNYEPISRTHPGLVQILQVGLNEEEQYFYYVMEAADDQATGRQIEAATYAPLTLGHILAERGKLAMRECVKVGTALADALGYLHQKKLIHRDIKPANIIFVNEAPKLADIGLVTELHSQAGEVTWIGTEGYIPPEGPGTAAADVFSLGKVLYQMSTGLDRRSFPMLPSAEVEPAESAAFKGFNNIVLKACENDSKARYQNGTELHADLQRLQERLKQGDVAGRPKGVWERLRDRLVRK
jgi:serine/threonine protein kinase